jgi:hypothetical protein
VGLQRAERDLDHHLAAVLAQRDEVHVVAHGPRTRRARVGVAVGGMARADGVGDERVHLDSHQRVDRIAEELRGHRIRQHDGAACIDDDERIGGRVEQGAQDRVRVEWRRHDSGLRLR